MEEENLAQNAYETVGHLRACFEDLQKKYPSIGDVRGIGLTHACEIVKENKVPDPAIVVKLFEELKKQGVLIGKGGLYGNVVRISPPLTVTKTEVDDFLKAMDEALAKC